MVDIRSNGRFLPCRFLARRRRRADFSEKNFPRSCWIDVLSNMTTFFTTLWLVTTASFIIFIQKPNDSVWNGITQLLSKKEQAKQCRQLVRPWELVWCAEGCILVEFVPQWEPIKSNNVQALQKLSLAVLVNVHGRQVHPATRKRPASYCPLYTRRTIANFVLNSRVRCVASTVLWMREFKRPSAVVANYWSGFLPQSDARTYRT
jgi:hypothetical protein